MGYQPPPGDFGPIYSPPPQPAIIPAPPASGSLLQAWVSVATKFSRDNIASWSQITTQGWVNASIVVTVLFQIAVQLVGSALSASISKSAFPHGISTASILASVISGIIGSVATVLAVPYALALFMPESFGSVSQRFERALKPWMLTRFGLGVVTLVLEIGAAIYGATVANVVGLHPDANTISQHLGQILLGAFIIFVLAALTATYSIALIVQSGAVGSNLNRWAVFGIVLLADLVVGIGIGIIAVVIFAIFGATGSFGHFFF